MQLRTKFSLESMRNFPPKLWNHNEENMNERRVLLEQFMNDVCRDPLFGDYEGLLVFLGVQAKLSELEKARNTSKQASTVPAPEPALQRSESPEPEGVIQMSDVPRFATPKKPKTTDGSAPTSTPPRVAVAPPKTPDTSETPRRTLMNALLHTPAITVTGGKKKSGPPKSSVAPISEAGEMKRVPSQAKLRWPALIPAMTSVHVACAPLPVLCSRVRG